MSKDKKAAKKAAKAERKKLKAARKLARLDLKPEVDRRATQLAGGSVKPKPAPKPAPLRADTDQDESEDDSGVDAGVTAQLQVVRDLIQASASRGANPKALRALLQAVDQALELAAGLETGDADEDLSVEQTSGLTQDQQLIAAKLGLTDKDRAAVLSRLAKGGPKRSELGRDAGEEPRGFKAGVALAEQQARIFAQLGVRPPAKA